MRRSRMEREMMHMFPNMGKPCPDLSGGMSLKDAINETTMEIFEEEIEDFFENAGNQSGSFMPEYDYDDEY